MSAVYRCGLLVDGTGNGPVRDALIWVENNRIKDVLGPNHGTPESVPVVDLSAYTVVPGLIDMHVHVDYWHSQPNVMEYMDTDALATCLAARNIRSTLEKGITTLRDVPSGVGLKMRRAVQLGYVPGSRIFTSGRGICMTGGHGSELPARLMVLRTFERLSESKSKREPT